LYWQDQPDVATEMVSSDGGQSLIFELFKVSCGKKEIFSVDVGSIWIEGFKSFTVESTKNEFLSKAFCHVKQSLSSDADETELVFQSFSLLVAT
jgi:hypothetical protein